MDSNLRYQFVRLSYSPEIMSMEFTREEMITIYDYIKSKEQEAEKLNNKLLKIKELISRTPRQTPTAIAYVMLKGEIAKVIGDGK